MKSINNSFCEYLNSVYRVDYYVTIDNSTLDISSINVDFLIIDNITLTANQFHEQMFSVHYLSTDTQTIAYEKTSNPGYVQGMPLKFGHAPESTASTGVKQFDNPMQLSLSDENGKCDFATTVTSWRY